MIERKFVLNNKKRFHICGAALFLCLTFVGCNKKEDTLGLGLYPEENQLGLLTTDTFTIKASTVRVDSVLADDLPISLLGSLLDSDFGHSVASFSAQFQPSTTSVNFGDISTLVVDSVNLSLVYLGYYGTQSLHQFTVNTLTEDIYKDSSYFSNRIFAEASESLLSQSVYSPNYAGKSILTSEEPEQLKLKLTTDFGKLLLDQVTISTNETEFVNLFKGIHVSSEVEQSFTSSASQGWGAIWSFDLANEYSKITVYYHNSTDTSAYDFEFSDGLTKVNHFNHDYTGTSAEQAISNSTLGGESLLYLQGMAGLAIDFQIPHIKGIISEGPVSINKAELVFTIEDGSTDEYISELDYFLVVKTETGSFTVTVDETDGQLSVGGELNSTNEYHFLINRDMQYLMNNYIEGTDLNFGYRLMNASSGIQSARTILKGTDTGVGEVKLIVSYTPI